MLFVASDSPRTAEPGKIYTGCTVKEEGAVRMSLQETSRYLRCELFLDGLLDDSVFAFSKSHDEDFLGCQNGTHPHCDGFPWNIVDIEEITSCICFGYFIQIYQSGLAILETTWLVEPYVSCLTYS